ncbi:MAG: hypothetical protein IPI72_13410 [Flavobacteriales bacterium]|nr:hypothetical protein [Flavobacteriales bacterium]
MEQVPTPGVSLLPTTQGSVPHVPRYTLNWVSYAGSGQVVATTLPTRSVATYHTAGEVSDVWQGMPSCGVAPAVEPSKVSPQLMGSAPVHSSFMIC